MCSTTIKNYHSELKLALNNVLSQTFFLLFFIKRVSMSIYSFVLVGGPRGLASSYLLSPPRHKLLVTIGIFSKINKVLEYKCTLFNNN